MTLNLFAQFEGLRNYNANDGLPSSDIYKVIQDSKGYIWTIGDMGVSRFNGYEFKNFSTENGLPENTVFKVFEDRHQRIWFCSISGKLSYYENDSIYTLACNEKLAGLLKLQLISSMYIDKGDTIWMGYNSEFIIKILPGHAPGDIQKIKLSLPYIYSIGKEEIIFGEAKLKKDTIWVYKNGLNKSFCVKLEIPPQNVYGLRFFALHLKDGTYMSSIGNSLIHFNEKGIIRKAKTPSTILTYKEDLAGDITICTYKGAFILKKNSPGQLKEIKQLHNQSVTDIYFDTENGTWISTEGHGLYYIPYHDLKYYQPINGIPESKISCIFGADSIVMLGHQDGHISFLKEDSIKLINIYTHGNKENTIRINCILKLNNKIIVATPGAGFYLGNNNFKEIMYDNTHGIKQMILSKNKNIWGISYSKIFNYMASPFLKTNKNIQCNIRIDNIFEDSNGCLWLSALDGVYNYYNDSLFKVEAGNNLFNLRCVATSEDKNKNIWIITRGGGVIIKRGNAFIQLTEQKGLAGNMCRSLLIDSNCIWIGTNKGLSKITPQRGEKYSIENYYVNNGLLSNEVNNIIKHNGKIYLSHNNGISVFDPAIIKNNFVTPKIYILSTFINDKHSKERGLNNLKYNENNIVINFIGLCYKNASHPEYKYKLEGVNSEWIITKYTSARYSTLPAGTYTFKVYACNNDGYWSKEPASITFTILPAWWQTWWFTLICIVLSVAFVAIIFTMRLNSIRKTEFEKETLRHKISAIELQALRSQMNPHFVFNAINSVQYFITSNDPDSSQKYLEKFASLIRYVLDNSKLSPIPLKTEINALNLYMELESLRFKFNYTIDIADSIFIDEIFIPSMLIQPYVENAIWHGLMHKKGEGTICITFKINNTLLKCIIEDNGIGRKRSAELKLNNGKIATHKSIGMSITKDRLDIINKINHTNLTVTITDLENELKEITGTRVEIDIPFNNF